MNIHNIIVCIGSNSGDSNGFGELEEELDLAYAVIGPCLRWYVKQLHVLMSAAYCKFLLKQTLRSQQIMR